ncbi:MAG: sigma-54 dependent transcriptional regulator [Desulfohalobiaceae bacterium]
MTHSGIQERVLLVEDDQSLKQLLAEELEDEGLAVHTEYSAEKAFPLIQSWEPDLVVSDLKLPEADGMELLRWSQQLYMQPSFLIITAFGSIPQAVEALKSGADDFLTKPLDLDHFRLSVQRTLRNQRLRKEVSRFRKLVHHQDFQGMIGRSREMRILYDQIQNIARAHGPVLVHGESGTGKELVAKALHDLSPRKNGPFQAINCAGIPADLLESEFFGHEEGAFTGANKKRTGLFPRCHEGTLLLDEIGEMPLSLQSKLLRVVQDGSFRPVGSNRERKADVRIICATNQNLEELTQEGRFREDLYYRLETFSISIPPLRKRQEDIELLAAHFVNRYNLQLGKEVEGLSEEALKTLEQYDFPGNIRELQNILERAVTFCHERKVDVDHLPFRLQRGNDQYPPESLQRIGEEFWAQCAENKGFLPSIQEMEKLYLNYVLQQVNGNKRRAAAILGISRRTLYRWMEEDS